MDLNLLFYLFITYRKIVQEVQHTYYVATEGAFMACITIFCPRGPKSPKTTVNNE